MKTNPKPASSPLDPLTEQDPDIASFIAAERERQINSIELIASENFASPAVMAAQGSVLTNKYAEGYPGRRYYGGCVNADGVERLAIERAKALFACEFANVQPHSGSQANQAVYLALLSPGDRILGLDLKAGGHLTHGASMNISGRWFDAVGYGVDPSTHLIDMEEVERLALEHRPRLIIAGGSAYSRMPDFEAFRRIADKVDAIFMVDMAHFAGLVAGRAVSSPFPHAHVVTSTTHKTLRGPRGGIILTNDPEISKKINSAIFPGLQGGPLMHVIAAKAVAFGEALQPAFRQYAIDVIGNCQVLADTLKAGGLPIVSGGTDTHLAVVDLRPFGVTGADAEAMLERCGITLNKNAIPGDEAKAMVTSGIRVGSAAGTTRGFGAAEYRAIGEMILEALTVLQTGIGVEVAETAIRKRVLALTARFPLPY
ncbi:serine hydroxymethyltransferase (plasmid) [Rhizobium sp. ACO-34A]|nr:serine hydroxymethyltransferase [Rhizobium sp. ACO-34A]ATN37599.1 serine hydroxymethyltransferase [Rhizobium sp. ACO-34A]